MVNLGCFVDWVDVPEKGEDGDYFNYFNDSDDAHETGIYYWNIRLVDKNGRDSPDWTFLQVNPDKPYRDDMLSEMLGAVNVQANNGKDIYQAIIQTTDRELDYYYRKGLLMVVSFLDKKSVEELPKNCDEMIYSANVSWGAGLLYDHKTYDYTAKTYAQMNIRYTPRGSKMIEGAKELLRPLAKNKDKNDINRSGALAGIIR